MERSDYYLQKAKEYEQKLNECEKTLYANSPDWAGLQAQEIEELENKIKSLEAEANGLKMRLAKEHENFLECWASYSKVLSELQHVRNEDINNTESNHHLAKRNYELEKLVDHWKLKYTCVCGHEYDYHNLETGDCGSCKCRNLRTSSTIEITSDDRNDK